MDGDTMYVCNIKSMVSELRSERLSTYSKIEQSGLFIGTTLDYKKDLHLSFGDYFQAYRVPVESNSMEPRTAAADLPN